MTKFSSASPESRGPKKIAPSSKRHSKRIQAIELDDEVLAKLREIEAGGEPLSIAETISLSEHQAVAGRVRRPDATDSIIDLQRLAYDELLEKAAQEGVQDLESRTREDLLFMILKEQVKTRRIMWANGTLQVFPDGYGFLRSAETHYLSSPDDIYVSPSQIRKFHLKTGSVITGQIRPPKERDRYFALMRIDSINGLDPFDSLQRKEFDELTALHPDQRIMLEHRADELSTRVIDMFVPLGFGQRGLIVSPPRAGKTIMMQNMARSVIKNYPSAYVIMLLIDERPEEVTDMIREVRGERCEVISSTFDEPASRHIWISEMVLEKAKRLVESGRDVVIFLDSITRLSRAWNAEVPQSGKTLTGGLDANAMQKPKAFFGSARKVEEGGSLTILATALINTGSRMDDVIFEEFKGTGNMEIVLDQTLVERRLWPAIDISASGTRREEKLLNAEEYARINQVRRTISQLSPVDAMTWLNQKLKSTKSNVEFLLSVQSEL